MIEPGKGSGIARMRKSLLVPVFVALILAGPARAQNQLTTSAVGAALGALVGGPIGFAAGAALGYVAGPSVNKFVIHAGPPARRRRRVAARPAAAPAQSPYGAPAYYQQPYPPAAQAGQGGFPPQPGLPQAPAQTASLHGPPRYLADPNARYMPYAYAPQPQQPPPNYGYPPAPQPQAAATATTPPQRVVRRRAPARAPKNGIFFIN